MRITITDGVAEGVTKLSAFYRALSNAGIGHYNLVVLSSVIPSDAKIEKRKFDYNMEQWGDILYIVMSSVYATEPNEENYAGIGWVQQKNNSGRGLFVEHKAPSKNQLTDLIHNSLTDMISDNHEAYSHINSHIVGVKCKEKPACALVAAVYKNQGWKEIEKFLK